MYLDGVKPGSPMNIVFSIHEHHPFPYNDVSPQIQRFRSIYNNYAIVLSGTRTCSRCRPSIRVTVVNRTVDGRGQQSLDEHMVWWRSKRLFATHVAQLSPDRMMFDANVILTYSETLIDHWQSIGSVAIRDRIFCPIFDSFVLFVVISMSCQTVAMNGLMLHSLYVTLYHRAQKRELFRMLKRPLMRENN